jgi:hypothetical protein
MRQGDPFSSRAGVRVIETPAAESLQWAGRGESTIAAPRARRLSVLRDERNMREQSNKSGLPLC